MTWVRRTRPAAVHTCPLPMREAHYKVPPLMVEWTKRQPDGSHGDLWRCPTCHALWRIGDGCDIDNKYGPHDGPCPLELSRDAWRPARLWQRIIYSPRGRTA